MNPVMMNPGNTMTDQDWQCEKSHQECNRYMLENQVSCDVKITFDPPGCPESNADSHLKAHSYMLMSRSCELQSLLKMTPRSQDGYYIISESHVDKHTFMEILKYIYYDGAELTTDNVLRVMEAAKQYRLSHLTSLCEQYLDNNLDGDSVCSILSQSISNGEEAISAKCIGYIAGDISDVLQSSDFINLTKEALGNLFESEDILTSSFNEIDLYNACIKWAEERKKKGDEKSLREILGKFLFKIRFALITPDELIKIIDNSPDLLTYKEHALHLRYVMQPTDRKATELEMLGFSVRQHGKGSNDVYATPSRFSGLNDSVHFCYNYENTDEIGFYVDKPINFTGISLYGGIDENDKHKVILSLSTENGLLSLAHMETTIVSRGDKDPIPIQMPREIPLMENKLYTIRVVIMGPKSYSGVRGNENIVAEGITFTFETIGTCHTSVVIGQIPQILFTKR